MQLRHRGPLRPAPGVHRGRRPRVRHGELLRTRVMRHESDPILLEGPADAHAHNNKGHGDCSRSSEEGRHLLAHTFRAPPALASAHRFACYNLPPHALHVGLGRTQTEPLKRRAQSDVFARLSIPKVAHQQPRIERWVRTAGQTTTGSRPPKEQGLSTPKASTSHQLGERWRVACTSLGNALRGLCNTSHDDAYTGQHVRMLRPVSTIAPTPSTTGRGADAPSGTDLRLASKYVAAVVRTAMACGNNQLLL